VVYYAEAGWGTANALAYSSEANGAEAVISSATAFNAGVEVGASSTEAIAATVPVIAVASTGIMYPTHFHAWEWPSPNTEMVLVPTILGLRSAIVSLGFRGALYVENPVVPIYADPTGEVTTISELPANPANGEVWTVTGNETVAIYYQPEARWIYQSRYTARNTFASPAGTGLSGTSIMALAPIVGTYIEMPNYVNFNGAPHTPKYWSVNSVDGSLNFAVQDITPDDSLTDKPHWRWLVSDLKDPGDSKYQLTQWPEHTGAGPTWYANYTPTVQNRTDFNIKKNKKRKQRSVHFANTGVDHIYMQYPPGLPQPFTVIVTGIIHSYPTAKFGHYILDAGKEHELVNIKGGKDYFFDENTDPRNVMLFMKHTARMATNTLPDLKDGKNIKIKHSEKARPRMFYGVFNGEGSMFGAIDTKYNFKGSGELDDLGVHRYFVIGRRTNRISDNRASHMSVWDIVIVHDALTLDEIRDIYHTVSSTYAFKEYT
jgi:hypothetical protein